MDDESTPAIDELRRRGIEHRIFVHSGSVSSLEQAASERNQRPEQVVRSIVFRLPEDRFVMVLMPGPGQVPWKALRRYLGQSRVTMASEDEVIAVTGYAPGTVTPFGLPSALRFLVDENVLKQTEVSLGSGKRGTAIMINPTVLIAALQNAEIVQFSDDTM